MVILWVVGIEIIFAIELRELWNFAIQQHAGKRGEAEGFVIGDGEDARKAEADRADVGVGKRAEFIGAAAPHFGLGLELNVGFEPDYRFVLHKKRTLEGTTRAGNC